MKIATFSRLSVAAACVGALSFFACGVDASYDDPTLGSYEEPLTSSSGVMTCTSSKKVLICHIPPGNPANAHSICVGVAAKPAHLNHGDVLGGCAGETNTSSDGGVTTGNGGGAGGGFDEGAGTGGGAGGGTGGTGGGAGGGTGGTGGGAGGGAGGGTGGTGGGAGGGTGGGAGGGTGGDSDAGQIL